MTRTPPNFENHEDELARAREDAEHHYWRHGWDLPDHVHPCELHGIRRCTICLGEKNR